MARPATVMISKIAPKSCGNPKMLVAAKDDVKRMDLGLIYGIADKIVERTNPDQTSKTYGLGGSFEAKPLDEELGISQSGICYLPDFVMQPILDMLGKRDDKGQRVVGNISFAFKVAVVRATNPQGYSWEFTPLTDPGETDPLADMRKGIDNLLSGQKQIAAPAGQVSETAPKAKAKA